MPSISPLYGPQTARGARGGCRTCQLTRGGIAALYGALRDSTRQGRVTDCRRFVQSLPIIVVRSRAGRLGTPPGGMGGLGDPSQALQPRIFCQRDFEIDLTASDDASARLEFSEKKGPTQPQVIGQCNTLVFRSSHGS